MKRGEFRKTETGFDFDPWAGGDIASCIKECVAKADSSHKTVVLRKFNGVDVIITPGTSVESAEREWRRQMDANAEAWRNRPQSCNR